MILRYASRSAISMYAGYRAEGLLVIGGMLQNPRTPYREIMAGLGRQLGPRGRDVTLAPAVAWSNTGWYAELYAVPRFHAGMASVSGILFGREPLSSTGTRAVFIAPLSMLLSVGSGFSVGGSWYGTSVRGVAPTHAVGPAIQHAIPHGWFRIEVLQGLVDAAPNELRLSLQSGF